MNFLLGDVGSPLEFLASELNQTFVVLRNDNFEFAEVLFERHPRLTFLKEAIVVLVPGRQEHHESPNQLFQQAECWNRSQELRRFIEAVKQKHLDNSESLEPGSEVSQWIAWAMQQADRVDPLCESPPSILDEKIPEEPKRWSW